ncbi:MAG TPA: thioesterase family protein [Anaeromyxobacteraceae bacterium]|nr:thioesterase family protein [Anaeromyxobacteraceae bacterium]
MVYKKHFVVRWSECDANGHLRNTGYSEYGIETRMSFLAENGFPYAWLVGHVIGPVIQREETDYLHELHMGEGIDVDFKGLGLSPDGARFKLCHDFWTLEGRKMARIVITGGWMDLRRRRLTSPPEDLLRLISSLEREEAYAELPNARKRGG